MRKIILPAMLLTGALAVGALGFSRVSAQENYLPIVERIAERFGLDIDEVQDVFEEERAEHHADMLTNFEDKLSEMVSGGKLTEEQKQAILDKHEEMAAKMDELISQDLSREEMRERVKAYHEETKAWAEENEIEFPFILFKAGFHRGRPGPMGKGLGEPEFNIQISE